MPLPIAGRQGKAWLSNSRLFFHTASLSAETAAVGKRSSPQLVSSCTPDSRTPLVHGGCFAGGGGGMTTLIPRPAGRCAIGRSRRRGQRPASRYSHRPITHPPRSARGGCRAAVQSSPGDYRHPPASGHSWSVRLGTDRSTVVCLFQRTGTMLRDPTRTWVPSIYASNTVSSQDSVCSSCRNTPFPDHRRNH